MIQKKQAFSSLASYTIILLLLLGLFSLFVGLSNEIKNDGLYAQYQLEIQRTAYDFKAELIPVIRETNAEFAYNNSLSPQGVVLQLSNRTINAQRITDSVKIEANTSTFGVPFCSPANISPSEGASISFNGSCLDVSTP